MGLLSRVRDAMARFLYGRNGVDQLTWVFLALELALYVAALFVRNTTAQMVVRLLSLVFFALILFRTFSRNLTKRRAENAKLLRWWNPKRAAVRGVRERSADKAHKYVKCACGVYCRVPRGVGKIELTCPKCGAKRVVKT